jgi:glycolate oxidase FAD binding subunit
MSVAVEGIDSLRSAVLESPSVLPHGACSKPALSCAPAGTTSLDVSWLSGILDYDPAELTFTALAGTPVAEVAEALAEHGQYLPFDPPLAASGATLGGVVASGASGPNAFRHGGVRDFIIGVQLIDGTGRLVSGGGKVVKNAAGFDLPKLMVGSMGRLGIIVRVSFKVFPRPAASATLRVDAGSLEAAVGLIGSLGRGAQDLDALDLHPPGELLLRLGGARETLEARVARLKSALPFHAELLDEAHDAEHWRGATELSWVPDGSALIRVALTPRRVPELQGAVAASGALARYSLGGNLGWLAWPADVPLGRLDDTLGDLGLAGMVLRGGPGPPLVGRATGGAFAARVRAAIDPDSRFPEV